MDKPRMIMFDYAQTLVYEKPIDVEAGMVEVLKYASHNPYQVSAKELAAFSSEIFSELVKAKNKSSIELHNLSFQRYVYEYYGLVFRVDDYAIERIFEEGSSKGHATANIEKLLAYLQHEGIRTAVISNMVFSGPMLKEKVNKYIGNHHFEFILASSEYAYCKPDKRLFDLALRKSGLFAKDVWYCGDSLACDVEGSFHAGMYPVWYKGSKGFLQEGQANCQCLEVDDWMEVIAILDSLA